MNKKRQKTSRGVSMGAKPKTLFTEVLGENARVKVIEFFVENRELDFGVGDIARETNLSRQMVYNVIEKFIEKDIIKETRPLLNKQMYGLNEGSRVVKRLKKLFDTIVLLN